MANFIFPEGQLPQFHLTAALEAIEKEGLQVPPQPRLAQILWFAHASTCLLALVAVEPPTDTDLNEFFQDLVIRAVNRAGGLWDAISN